MSLTAAITEATGSYQEVLATVRARTVSTLASMKGARLEGVLIGAGLLPLIKRVAKTDTDPDVLFHGICQGLTDRVLPEGEIDFSDPENIALIDMFLANETVSAILAAGPYVTGENLKAVILAKASQATPEFPNVTLRDVIAVKTPELAMQQESLPVTIKGISQVLKLTTAAAMPETTRLSAQISHDGIVWQPVQTSGLESVSGAGLYVFRVLPGPVFITESQIRVVSDYSVGLSLV